MLEIPVSAGTIHCLSEFPVMPYSPVVNAVWKQVEAICYLFQKEASII